jgi:hypothetical protein
MDLSTGRRTQLTTTARHHHRPWCGPDNKSVLFTTGALDKTLYRFDRVTKRETPVMTLEREFYAVSASLSDSRVLVQEYGGIIEIIDINSGKSIRRFSGVNPVVSADRKLLAWQTNNPDPFSEFQPHILFSDLNAEAGTDIGEGRTPVFASDSELLFLRQPNDTLTEIVRYNTRSRIEQVSVAKGFEYGRVLDSTLGGTP